MLQFDNNKVRWWIFTACGFMAAMLCLDVTITNVALAVIARDLHATMSQIQWVTNIYLLTGVMIIVFAGRLADIFSRRLVYVFGIVTFTAASLVAGFAPNLLVLIIGRGLQGIGFGCTITLGAIIITSVFPINKRGMILGNFVAIIGFSQAVGPTVGGVILQYLNWRWIFFINIPLGIIATLLISIFYHHSSDKKEDKIDFIGFILLASGLFLLIFALNELGHWGLRSQHFLTVMAISIFLFILFYIREYFVKYPLVKFSLYRNYPYLAVTLVRWLYVYVWMAMLFLFPLYMQNIIGLSPLATGLMLLFMTVVLGSLSIFIGRVLDRVGFEWPLFLSIFLALLAFILFAQLKAVLSLPILITAFVLFGFSIAILVSATIGIALESLPEDNLGVGMGGFYTSSIFGCAAGVAVSGSLIEIINMNSLLNKLAQAGLKFSSTQLAALQHVVSGAHSVKDIYPYFSHKTALLLVPMIKDSYVHGLSAIMWGCAVFLLIALLLCIPLIRKNM
ncbi:MAG: MFS transporter [Gammaproteobacteria bacterium]|jgi:EmrB/QacA subfamily drug resistance transporter